ncbi:MAG: hypothetical protein ACKVW3_16700 [Phycisphaerales bacterium]
MLYNHRWRALWLSALLVASATLAGCESGTRIGAFRNPSLGASFVSIPNDETTFISEGMVNAGASSRTATPLSYTLPLSRKAETYTVDEICDEIRHWHGLITAIRNSEGTSIASNDAIIIELKYVSTKAESGSGATVFIRPLPSDAKLFLESKVPGVTEADDGSAVLNKQGELRVALPFSYIKSTDRIYFMTRYAGAVRYFYYDISKQRQEEVPATTKDEWEIFKKTGVIPKR